VITAQAPGLEEALERAVAEGTPCVILDGEIVDSDRCHEKTISRKGREIDLWYSGKRKDFGRKELDINARTRNMLLSSARCLGGKGLRTAFPALEDAPERHREPQRDRTHHAGRPLFSRYSNTNDSRESC
jgi:hypothetical protein